MIQKSSRGKGTLMNHMSKNSTRWGELSKRLWLTMNIQIDGQCRIRADRERAPVV